MPGGGDYDDAVDMIDVWLQEHPQLAPWEREETTLPWQSQSDSSGGYRYDIEDEVFSTAQF